LYPFTPASATANAAAYGCDQCHDAVGVATNSTAFPHGNNGIEIYEWKVAGSTDGSNISATAGVPSGAIVAGGHNIWMYASNMSAWSDANSTTTSTLVDPSFTLIQGATEGYGNAVSGIGNIEDAVCLKCHVPYDAASAKAWGLTGSGTGFLYAGSGHGHGRPAISKTANINTLNPTGNFNTGWIFLWR
ncbi:MAG: hypothetical protein FWD65_04065, partial [Coriobacteriia bacterium]|nr:hypothetical protein [Coriobacteriia bacterium]